MRLKIILVLTLLVLAGLVGSFVQIQPPRKARVIRNENKIRVLGGRIGWSGRLNGSSCLVPEADGQLEFSSTLDLTDIDGDIYPLDIRFVYDPPTGLSNEWPQGDWCQALRERLRHDGGKWLQKQSRDELLSDLRASAWKAATHLQEALTTQGVSSEFLSARFRLPQSVMATRAIPEVRDRAETTNPVIFVGLDGADWELLDGYIAAGLMPNLETLVREGNSGVLMTQHPPLSPLLWTTMMTGVSPLRHQILDFTRFHSTSRVREPITSEDRRAPAIWNMLTYAGKRSATLGLWATYPAEPINGLLVSDRLFTFLYREASPPPGVVFPQRRESWARQFLNRAEDETNYQRLRAYLPWLPETEYDAKLKVDDPYSHPVSALRRILVETAVYEHLASSTLAQSVPDLTIVYLQGTDTIGHVFAPYVPPRLPQISKEDFEKYHQVPERYFREVDRILGEFKNVAERAGAVLFLASDHGFRWHEGRPTLSSFAVATAAKWHREQGIYLLWGRGIRPTAGHSGRGRIDQVCPTLLALLGVPPGAGFPLALPGVSSQRGEPIDYGRFFHPISSASRAPSTGDEELAKLRALGYIGANEPVRASGTAGGNSTRSAGSYNNEGLILRSQNQMTEAIAAFEKAIGIDPNLASALWNLSDLLFQEKRDLGRSDNLLAGAVANELPEGQRILIGRAIGYQRAGNAERSLALLEQAVNAQPQDAEFRMFRGRYRIDLKDCAGALDDFRVAQQIRPDDPVPFASAGLAAMCLGNRSLAEENFRRSLEINPNQPQLRSFLKSAQ